jgi:hypothetical protein
VLYPAELRGLFGFACAENTTSRFVPKYPRPCRSPIRLVARRRRQRVPHWRHAHRTRESEWYERGQPLAGVRRPNGSFAPHVAYAACICGSRRSPAASARPCRNPAQNSPRSRTWFGMLRAIGRQHRSPRQCCKPQTKVTMRRFSWRVPREAPTLNVQGTLQFQFAPSRKDSHHPRCLCGSRRSAATSAVVGFCHQPLEPHQRLPAARWTYMDWVTYYRRAHFENMLRRSGRFAFAWSCKL